VRGETSVVAGRDLSSPRETSIAAKSQPHPFFKGKALGTRLAKSEEKPFACYSSEGPPMGFLNPMTPIIIFFPLSVDDFLRFMFALGKPTSRMLKVDSLH